MDKARVFFGLFSMCMVTWGMAPSITIDDLAARCKQMESDIKDICLEYAYFAVPPLTFEELQVVEGTSASMPWIIKDSRKMVRFCASGLLGPLEPSGSILGRLPQRYILRSEATMMSQEGKSWKVVDTSGFDGKVSYTFREENLRKIGSISRQKQHFAVLSTPLAFSVFRLAYSPVTDYKPLSQVLGQKEFVRLNTNVTKIVDFNAISVELLNDQTRQPVMRVYFSVDHGYTPVKYESLNYGSEVSLCVQVESLEKVADHCWLPTSGQIWSADERRVYCFMSTGKVQINQGLEEKDFRVSFPPGTQVDDAIKGTRYVVPAD